MAALAYLLPEQPETRVILRASGIPACVGSVIGIFVLVFSLLVRGQASDDSEK